MSHRPELITTPWAGLFDVPVGNYMRVPQIASSQNGSLASTLNQLNAWYFTLLRTVTITKLGVALWVNGSSGSVVRIGLWKALSSGYPGALITDTGGVAATAGATTLLSSTLGTSVTLGPGGYYAGAVTQASSGTTPTLISHDGLGLFGSLTVASNGADKAIAAYRLTGVSGALPDPFTAGATTLSNTAGTTGAAAVFLGA